MKERLSIFTYRILPPKKINNGRSEIYGVSQQKTNFHIFTCTDYPDEGDKLFSVILNDILVTALMAIYHNFVFV